jgi:hypothetical protein
MPSVISKVQLLLNTVKNDSGEWRGKPAAALSAVYRRYIMLVGLGISLGVWGGASSKN